MRRVEKGFSGVETPLFEKPAAEEVVNEVVQPAPTPPSPPSPVILSSPPYQPPCSPQPQAAKVSSILFQQVLDTCPALARRVEGLENDKAAQQLEIVKLKPRVNKLEKIYKVKSSKLRRLKKVGTSQRVESSYDMENVFNQGRMIADMNMNEGIELVKDTEVAESEGRNVADHTEKQAEMYNIDMDHSSKVLSMQKDDTEVQEAVEIVTTAKLMTEVVTAAATQVVAASTPIPAAKPKILNIAPKPMKKKDQIEMDAEYARKLQEEINKEHEKTYKNIDWNAALDHVQSKEPQHIKRYHGMKKKPQTESEARKNMIFYLKNTKAKEDEDLKKQLEVVDDEDDVFIEATPIGRKVPVVDYEIVMINNKPRYKIIKADGTHQLYISFITLLKNFDREDLEDL
nr:hypothetical protein [Tanacetum cinerariifolium]